MQLAPLNNSMPDGVGLVCRQGRTMAAISTPFMMIVLGGAPVLWWSVGAPWPVWGLCALVALICLPLLWGDLRSKFRATNWLLWIRSDGLSINFRSYQDQGPTDTLTVVQLAYSEIKEVSVHRETYSTASNGRSTHWSIQYLDLRLKGPDDGRLNEALTSNRWRKGAVRSLLGFIETTSTPSHFPVSLPEPDLLRIAWRGGYNWAAPSLKRVLRELAPYIHVAEATKRRRGDWKDLDEAQVDDQILDLLQSGQRIHAMKLLTERRGYSLTQANEFVEQLAGRV